MNKILLAFIVRGILMYKMIRAFVINMKNSIFGSYVI